MARNGKNVKLNHATLMMEAVDNPRVTVSLWKVVVCIVGSLCIACLYFFVYVSVLGFDPPKTAILRKKNAVWHERLTLMDQKLDACETSLNDLEQRSDNIYRSIFGMNSIPKEILNSGFGGVNRYDYFAGIGSGSELESTYRRLDVLVKKTCMESKSYDEISLLSKRAGDMASCTPAILPVDPVPGKFKISSYFGGREDPIFGGRRFHEGIDFSARLGTPVYVTGDGVVAEVSCQFFGYGNSVVVDHGFGYRTRYAHLHTIHVTEGMKVRRGECIGTVGSTGKSTAPHLHYEVEYRNRKLNPINFFDLGISQEEYEAMVSEADTNSDAILNPKYRYRR